MYRKEIREISLKTPHLTKLRTLYSIEYILQDLLYNMYVKISVYQANKVDNIIKTKYKKLKI